jgi:hypothetical protein
MTTLDKAKRVYQVYKQWIGAGRSPSLHAQERADICVACPHNKPVVECVKVTTFMEQALRAQLELKTQMKLATSQDNNLLVCELCGCFMKVKVHVPLDIARANTPDWKGFIKTCWLHRDDLT